MLRINTPVNVAKFLKGEIMYLLLIFLMSFIIPLIALPGLIKKRIGSPYRIVLYASLISSAAAFMVFAVAAMSGESVFSQLDSTIDAMADILARDNSVAEIMNMSDVAVSERADFFTKLYQEVFESLPASIMTFNAVIAYFEYILMSRTMTAKNVGVRLMPKFREFSLPAGTIWGILIMYLVSWLMTTTETLPNDLLYVNMDLIFDFVLALQGISVVFMLFHMKKLPRAVAVVVIIVLWGTYMGRWILIMLGMFDIIIGLKIRIQNGKSGR